jgi:hypothetical protein
MKQLELGVCQVHKYDRNAVLRQVLPLAHLCHSIQPSAKTGHPVWCQARQGVRESALASTPNTPRYVLAAASRSGTAMATWLSFPT